jgi:hypothetical protein
MGNLPREPAPKQLGKTAMWLGVGSLVVGVATYLAIAVWIQCPPAYQGIPCREIEVPNTMAGLVLYLAAAVCLVGAVYGAVALLRGERPWPALLPSAVVAGLLVNWIARW